MTSLTTTSVLFKNILGALHLDDEAHMKFDDEGMHVRMVDPAHVAMISLNVPKASFAKYELSDIKDAMVDMTKWKDVAKLTSVNDFVEIEIKNGSINYRVGNVRRKSNLLAATDGDIKIPNLKLEGRATINCAELKRAVKATEGNSDHVVITLGPTGIIFDSKDETSESSMTIPTEFLKDPEGAGRSLFPMDYFSSMVGGFPEGVVLLTMGNDLPMKMTYMGDIEVVCLIAPRIENDA